MRVSMSVLVLTFAAIAFPLTAAEDPDWLKPYEKKTYISPTILGRAEQPEARPPQAPEKLQADAKQADGKQADGKQADGKQGGQRRPRGSRRRGTIGPELLYRLMSPETIEPGKTYPLVLYLHGSGTSGSDNRAQLFEGGGVAFAKPENRKKYPCFLVAPQCPPSDYWADINEREAASVPYKMPEKPTISLGRALELVDKLANELPVDKNRIYVTGLSMGGYGVWDAIQRRPDLFAAAMPVAGGGDKSLAPKFKDVAIWAFHGEKDRSVPVFRTREMIEALTKAGGAPKMTIYAGASHNVWERSYNNPEVFEWLYAQRKK